MCKILTVVNKPTKLKYEKNTDANSIFLGFHYQALKTVDEWLSNYKEAIIYCENEDDIKLIDKETNTLKFKQIKCYSNTFSLNSVEIQKSIFNFFLLFHKYSSNETYFYFEATNSIAENSNEFKDWFNNQYNDSYDYELIEGKVKETLINLIEEMKKNKKSKKKLNEYDEITERIKDKTFIDFVKRIKWVFENKNKDIAVDELIKSIKSKVVKIVEYKNIPDLATARLLTEVYTKSSASVIEKRRLDFNLFQEIRKETQEQIEKSSKEFYLDFFRLNHDKQVFEKLNTIMSDDCFHTIIKKLETYQFNDGEIDSIYEFIDENVKIKNHFINDELNTALTNFIISLKKLKDCVFKNFFVFPNHKIEGKYRFRFRPNDDVDLMEIYDQEKDIRFSEKSEQFDSILDYATEKYNIYRNLIKNNLYE